MFEREVSLYRRLQENGIEVSFITYGNAEDRQYADRIPGIDICCNRWGFSYKWYRKLIPLLHWRTLRRADLLKTNQTRGASVAIEAGRVWKKPVIARCGYMWSEFVSLEQGPNSPAARKTLQIESNVFNRADRLVVTTTAMEANLIERFPKLKSRISIIPNYVDEENFQPQVRRRALPPRLCFIGRLCAQKNVPALIEAVHTLDVELDIIGKGPLQDQLTRQAAGNDCIRFLGRIAHEELHACFRNSTVFVLCSLYEGHPKTLIEAMTYGLPVVGTDVSGIREVIQHGENGWLCQTDAQSLRAGIMRVLSDHKLQDKLAANARRFALKTYSLQRVVETELALYQELIAERRGPSN